MEPARRALVSVSDKNGVVDFARALVAQGFEIVSTGGTARHLVDHGVPVVPVSEATGSPEILGGRVKTLHPKVHGGILADRGEAAHRDELAAHGIAPVDVVAVNLYPFAETVARPGVTTAEAVEQIDIGGPTMVRAAAKNHAWVTVVVDPADYPRVAAALEAAGEAEGESEGAVPAPLRRELAAKAFLHTRDYDAAVAAWFADREPTDEPYPPRLDLSLDRVAVPRYGENPHQPAAVYAERGAGGVFGGFRQLQGKEMSWNNLLDADAARKMVGSFEQPAVVIVKHNNPCGVGIGASLVEAYRRALATDPVSAFGSIVALNRPADEELAAAVAELFVEVLTAPAFASGALELLAAKRNLRLIEAPVYDGLGTGRPVGDLELRAIDGGYLAQAADAAPDDPAGWECPTARQPSGDERQALELAWKVCRYTKSNAIVVANPVQTVGVGAGQMSRVDSCRLAVEKARLPVAGTVAASDAFFPFRDGLDALAEAGVTAVVQPGGSRRDDEVVAAADEHGLAMLLTGRRHFRH